MILTFLNNNQITVNDISTIRSIRIEVSSFTELDSILSNFTKENMKRVILEENLYTDIIPESYSIRKDFEDEEPIMVYVTCREKTEMERMAEEITELQEALVELGEGLIND